MVCVILGETDCRQRDRWTADWETYGSGCVIDGEAEEFLINWEWFVWGISDGSIDALVALVNTAAENASGWLVFIWTNTGLLLTHWGRVMHICISKLAIIGSDNGLSPGQCQAIIWTNAEILLIGLLGTNLNGIIIEIHTFSFKKMYLKTSSGKLLPFCLNMLIGPLETNHTEIWVQIE